MSKERELLQALKDSINEDPYSAGAELAKEATQQMPAPSGGGASTAASEFDVAGLLDFFNAMGGSMIEDPLFYVKLTGIVILGIIILLVAFELIIGS